MSDTPQSNLDFTTVTDGDLTLRFAEEQDAEMLLSWRNDPKTRQWSREQDVIELEDHLRWLRAVLQNPLVTIFVAYFAEQPVGTIRTDFREGLCELSWTVAPAARGMGIAGRMASMLADQIDDTIVAFVQRGNEPSIRVAEKAGLKYFSESAEMLEFRRAPKS